jgi:hypothetical protein
VQAKLQALVSPYGSIPSVPEVPVVPLLVLVAGAIMAVITKPWRPRNTFGAG